MKWPIVAILVGVAGVMVGGIIAAQSQPNDTTNPAGPVLATPELNEREAAALQVFRDHCASCHDRSLTQTPFKFDNILDVRAIAADPTKITIGDPSSSYLFQRIVNGTMPLGGNCAVDRDLKANCPSTADVEVIREWIQGADRRVERPFISDEDIATAMADFVERFDRPIRDDIRFITLTNIWNDGDPDFESYRLAAIKLLNSLSRRAEVLSLEDALGVEPAGTVLAFRLSRLGWSSEEWRRLEAEYPYGLLLDDGDFRSLQQETETLLPFLRADWLAFVATQPDLYYDLLDLPESFDELLLQLGVELTDNIADQNVVRIGRVISGVSQNNRLIERHTGTGTPMFWTSYDFATNAGTRNLINNPLGPRPPLGPPGGDDAFRFEHDGGETIFALPNGFFGYYLNNAEGGRLGTGPTNIVQDRVRQEDPVVTVGISCIACHAAGINRATDQVRLFALGTENRPGEANINRNPNFPDEVTRLVSGLYLPTEAAAEILDRDARSFADALLRAGLNVDMTINGFEPVYALARWYSNPVDLRRAAADYGLEPDAYSQETTVGFGVASDFRRLSLGIVIRRDDFEATFAERTRSLRDPDEPVASKRLELDNFIAQFLDGFETEVVRPNADGTENPRSNTIQFEVDWIDGGYQLTVLRRVIEQLVREPSNPGYEPLPFRYAITTTRARFALADVSFSVRPVTNIRAVDGSALSVAEWVCKDGRACVEICLTQVFPIGVDEACRHDPEVATDVQAVLFQVRPEAGDRLTEIAARLSAALELEF